jgi:DNA-binding GntR family transcriptional regulator
MPLKSVEVPDLGATPPASDVIREFIRNAIIDGSLDEGEPIRQDEVARIFNVSKIPVREALKRLEAEGFVEFQRNRGAVVTSLTEPEVAQIFEVRALLESKAISLSIPNMTESTLKRAEERSEAFARETDVARWSELNWQFHLSLYEDADRPFLIDLIRSIYDRIERYVRVLLSFSDATDVAVREHREMIELCRKGDVDRAAQLVNDHIMVACLSLHKCVPSSKKS